MPLPLPLRRAASRWAGALALCAAALSVHAAQPIQDPHYGDSLFHFYQEQYFTSVVGLMVSQHFGRVAHHADEAEVLRGGLLLSYGMHREAGEVFAALIDQGAPPAVRDRAWFFLAKIRYQRGQYSEAREAVERVTGKLPGSLEEERGLLRGDILLALGDYRAAAQALTALAAERDASAYARFNLGVALVKSGDAAGGSALLDALGRAGAPDEELRSLRDRANLALGYAALQQHEPAAARAYLERVRLDSAQASKALLGYGWAAAELKQPRQALVPWTELVQRSALDAAGLEAHLALAYAYAELGAYGQALARYDDAISTFERESRSLDETIAAVRAGKLVDALLARNPGAGMGWFWSIRELPAMPHATHLAPLFAQHEFQESFKNYRDLHFLALNLRDWSDKLSVFDDMLTNRRKAHEERLPRVRAQAAVSRVEPLRQRREALAAELARSDAAPDGAAFADAAQQALLSRIASASEALKTLPAGPEADAARERLRLAQGLLTWDFGQQLPQRLWEAKKSLAATDRALDEAVAREAALMRAQGAEPIAFDAFDARIAALTQRIGALETRVAGLSREQRLALENIAVAELVRQQRRLAEYATQARFAVAQLYDRATLAREAGHAPR